MREDSDSTAVQTSHADAANPTASVCGALTPELRTQLQICLVSVETLSALDLPLEAHMCVLSIKRAVDLLVKELTGDAPRQIADSCRLFR